MPFSTDNSWPAGLLKIFEICRDKNKPLENRYYGPYDKLLNYCSGDSFTFFVAPPNPLGNDASNHRPVLIAEIGDDSWANNAGLRLEADQQLRRRYNIMLDTCALPRLWAVSLLGTSLRIYCGDVATRIITPPYQARPHEDYVVPPGFLDGEWNLDILSQEGFDKMKEIVGDITTSTAALEPCHSNISFMTRF